VSALDVDSVGPHDFELSNTVTNVWSRGDEEFDLLNIGVRQSRCVWSDDLQPAEPRMRSTRARREEL